MSYENNCRGSGGRPFFVLIDRGEGWEERCYGCPECDHTWPIDSKKPAIVESHTPKRRASS